MRTGDANALAAAIRQGNVDMTNAHNRVIHLANLVAFGQVGIKIVFARKH